MNVADALSRLNTWRKWTRKNNTVLLKPLLRAVFLLLCRQVCLLRVSIKGRVTALRDGLLTPDLLQEGVEYLGRNQSSLLLGFWRTLSHPTTSPLFVDFKDLLTSTMFICPVWMPSSGSSVRSGGFSGAGLFRTS